MPETDRAFAGAIPDVYDRLLVPLIFEPYAADLAERVARLAPRAVLEVAAGTGVVPRALAPRLGSDATYVVTDLNPPMLERARARQPEDGRIEWRQADATALPFEDARFDVVLCQFGVMFLPDRVAGYREAARVLRTGGRLLFSAWDGLDGNDVPDTVWHAVVGCYPDDPPTFFSRVPHGYNDVRRIRADVEAAGFGAVEIETVTCDCEAPDAGTAAVAFCQGTPIRNEIEARRSPSLADVTDRAAGALTARYGPGTVRGRIRAHVVTAVRP